LWRASDSTALTAGPSTEKVITHVDVIARRCHQTQYRGRGHIRGHSECIVGWNRQANARAKSGGTDPDSLLTQRQNHL
jgi:hypothetical protein